MRFNVFEYLFLHCIHGKSSVDDDKPFFVFIRKVQIAFPYLAVKIEGLSLESVLALLS